MSEPHYSSPLSAAVLLDALVQRGISHLVGVPDNGSAALFDQAAADSRVTLLTVAREGEAMAVASGLWLGGRHAAVVIQNTGLLESGDALRGTAMRMGVPLLLLIGVRGHAKLRAHAAEVEAARGSGPAMTAIMQRADIDSVAVVTQPTLAAWGIPHVVYEVDADVEHLVGAHERALQTRQPHAVLLPRGLS